jgi:ribosome-binding protein aMBF1 (putative translation factor)
MQAKKNEMYVDLVESPPTTDKIGMLAASCRAARALLGWSQTRLAEEANVGVMVVKNYERGTVDTAHSSWRKMKAALERAGIEFIETGVTVGATLRMGDEK